MAGVSFGHLMEDAERHGYAVGFFESWGMESLLAVAEAAESARSPVILGYIGIFLLHRESLFKANLRDFAVQACEVAECISVPAYLLFNESPHLDLVMEAIARHFDLVMYTDGTLPYEALVMKVRSVVVTTHACGVAVEGENDTLPGVGGSLEANPSATILKIPSGQQSLLSERVSMRSLLTLAKRISMVARICLSTCPGCHGSVMQSRFLWCCTGKAPFLLWISHGLSRREFARST